MEQLSSEELITAYRSELRRVYGHAYEQACYVFYEKGWYYISHPFRDGIRYKKNPLKKPVRKGELIGMIKALKGKQS